MTPPNVDQQTLRDAFHALRSVPLDQREQRLRDTFPERPDLTDQLRRLLIADDSSHAIDDLGKENRVGLERLVHEPASLIGRALGHYRVSHEIGRGATGIVYRADRHDRSTVTPAVVAIKVLHPGIDDLRFVRFQTEYQKLESLDHPGIVRAIGIDRLDDGRPYFLMEHIDGAELLTHCDLRRPPVTDLVRRFINVCEALAHAHERSLIHRDLKPSNILVPTDTPDRAVIVDWGTVLDLDRDRLTIAGERIGTPKFMSPEQREGLPATVRSDLYSLGVTLDHALDAAGHTADTRPREIGWILTRCQEQAPEDRYTSAHELAADLRNYLNHETLVAAPPSPLRRAMRDARRNKVAVAAAAITLVILAAFVIKLDAANTKLNEANAELVRQDDAIRAVASDMVGGILSDMAVRTDASNTRDELIRLSREITELLDPDDEAPLSLRFQLASLDAEEAALLSDRSELEDALTLQRRASERLEELASEAPRDVTITRAYAKSLIKIGDLLHALDAGDRAPYYGEALRLQQSALEHAPDHLAIRDDLCWSYERHLWLTSDPDERLALLNKRMALAIELFDETPDRSLSAYNLASAHEWTTAFLISNPDRDQDGAVHHHAAESIRIADQLVRLEPDRAAYTAIQIRSRLRAAAIANATGAHDDAAEALRFAERRLRDTQNWIGRQRGLEFTMLNGTVELINRYRDAGRTDDADRCFAWLCELRDEYDERNIQIEEQLRNRIDRFLGPA